LDLGFYASPPSPLHLHDCFTSITPFTQASLVVIVTKVVEEGVHVVRGGEDGIVVGLDIAGGECNELTSAPENLPEKRVGVVRIGEMG
jgi:hypothetical protein